VAFCATADWVRRCHSTQLYGGGCGGGGEEPPTVVGLRFAKAVHAPMHVPGMSFPASAVKGLSTYISYRPAELAVPSSPRHPMPIKISITIELFTWPGRRVPLGLWSRVRTRIRRKYEGSHTSNWSFWAHEDITEDCMDHPPPYIGHNTPPAILITPSTPTNECNESISWYEARISSASEEQTCQDLVPGMERSGTYDAKLKCQHYAYARLDSCCELE
jgi:hypothetical protein